MKKEIGMKFDGAKPRWELLPLDTVEDIVKVMTYGAKKYADNNWKKVTPKERYLAAALRHMTLWQKGERVDTESGLPHLAHALCSLLFLHWLDEQSKGGVAVSTGSLSKRQQRKVGWQDLSKSPTLCCCGRPIGRPERHSLCKRCRIIIKAMREQHEVAL